MTIFLVCFAFFVCVTPFMICHFLSDFGISFQVGTFCTCLYWLQYCINFFIYILRSEQYSKAYLILFRKVSKFYFLFLFFFCTFFFQMKHSIVGTTVTNEIYVPDLNFPSCLSHPSKRSNNEVIKKASFGISPFFEWINFIITYKKGLYFNSSVRISLWHMYSSQRW